MQDIGTSRLAQLEALEKAITEAGPQGRRVVDLPVDEEGEEQPMQNGGIEGLSVGKSVCKVLIEDGRGERVFGMEVKPIEGIKVGMSLGCKVCSLGFERWLIVVVVDECACVEGGASTSTDEYDCSGRAGGGVG